MNAKLLRFLPLSLSDGCRLVGALVLTLIFVGGGTDSAHAQQLIDRRYALEDERQRERAREPGISMDAAVARAQSRYRARAVKADVGNEGGRRIYYIRLLSREGRVWTVRVDANTGQME
jgi:uncharacterized membrane protein YkoI